MTAQLLDSIKSSFTYSTSDGSTTDLVEDPYSGEVFCAYCGDKITLKKVDGVWTRMCDCFDANSAMKEKEAISLKIKSLQERLVEIDDRAKSYMLETYKKIYQRRIPDRDQNMKNIDSEILGLTKEDI
jgi:uncharacterized Zn finger protein (UPF0148 family)